MGSCASCAIGKACGVGHGPLCPFVTRHRRAGEHLQRQGEAATSVSFIKSGAVALLRELPGGETLRAVRGGGALIGLEILLGDRYLDSARALTDVTVCELSRAGLDAFLGQAAAARAVLEQAVRGLVDAPRGAGPDGNATCRVARWILDGGAAATVPRQMAASLLGMVPETLSRALAELRRRGAIDASRRSIAIRDRDRLVAAAER